MSSYSLSQLATSRLGSPGAIQGTGGTAVATTDVMRPAVPRTHSEVFLLRSGRRYPRLPSQVDSAPLRWRALAWELALYSSLSSPVSSSSYFAGDVAEAKQRVSSQLEGQGDMRRFEILQVKNSP